MTAQDQDQSTPEQLAKMIAQGEVRPGIGPRFPYRWRRIWHHSRRPTRHEPLVAAGFRAQVRYRVHD